MFIPVWGQISRSQRRSLETNKLNIENEHLGFFGDRAACNLWVHDIAQMSLVRNPHLKDKTVQSKTRDDWSAFHPRRFAQVGKEGTCHDARRLSRMWFSSAVDYYHSTIKCFLTINNYQQLPGQIVRTQGRMRKSFSFMISNPHIELPRWNSSRYPSIQICTICPLASPTCFNYESTHFRCLTKLQQMTILHVHRPRSPLQTRKHELCEDMMSTWLSHWMRQVNSHTLQWFLIRGRTIPSIVSILTFTLNSTIAMKHSLSSNAKVWIA